MSKRTPAAVIADRMSPKKKVKVDSNLSSNHFPNITTLFNKDHKPIGWIFEGFFDGREYLKKLSNKNGSVTVIGEIEFKAFSNLKTKWMPESMLGDHLWGIQIEMYDGSKEDDTMRWFPSEQDGVAMAWAKKIARSMIKAEVYKNVEVKERILTKNEECDFMARFATVSYSEAASAISLEAIAPGAFEDLI
jgi:hypothetical protein